MFHSLSVKMENADIFSPHIRFLLRAENHLSKGGGGRIYFSYRTSLYAFWTMSQTNREHIVARRYERGYYKKEGKVGWQIYLSLTEALKEWRKMFPHLWLNLNYTFWLQNCGKDFLRLQAIMEQQWCHSYIFFPFITILLT